MTPLDTPSITVAVPSSPAEPAAPEPRPHLPVPLPAAWQLLVTAPDAAAAPDALPSDAAWLSAAVPGTALAALSWSTPPALHDHDVWYRAAVLLGAGEILRFDGLAGLCEIWLDGQLLAASNSMFVSIAVTVPHTGGTRLALCFRSLFRRLRSSSRGRARWRTRLVADDALRHHRQTLLGHMPGWCPPFHAVGPYRAIRHLAVPDAIASCRLDAAMRDADGLLTAAIAFHGDLPSDIRLTLHASGHATPLHRTGLRTFSAILTLPAVARWWPHTHGEPALHDVFLRSGDRDLLLGRVGFRDLRVDTGSDDAGFALRINGEPVFCRGACWTSADLLTLGGDRERTAGWLRAARDAGLNMIRVGGTMCYEDRDFHALCDELGLLVWQDLMFANLDYSLDREPLRGDALREVEQLLERLAGSPSLAVLCGGSEMAQQAAMLGLSVERRRCAFFEDELPDRLARLRPDLPYLPHTPWGGPLPMTVSQGVSHYYGVGAYRRPLEDARRAGVRFASECLALANPPAADSPAAAATASAPRDPGAPWDFADIRDHYLALLYAVDPRRLRGTDPARYLSLSRAVTADLMEAAFGEWRRPGSLCAGALVWQLQDVAPGSGWGLVDCHGIPKSAWHGLRRVSAPVQVLLSDEGLDGLGVHVLNETASALPLILRLSCLRRGAVPVASAEHPLHLAPRAARSFSSPSLLDGFFDITRAYEFGPPEHSVTVATLLDAATGAVRSEAFHFPLGRALPPDDLALSATMAAIPLADGEHWCLDVSAQRFAQSLHVECAGYRADPDWFHLPPGPTRRLRLLPLPDTRHPPHGLVSALNAHSPAFFGSPP